MQRLGCDQSLKLQLPDCATAPTAAVLQRAGFASIAMVIEPTDAHGGIVITPASQPARGVWQLRVTTACGCYHAQIAVDACKPIGFQSIHTSSRHEGVVTVCCDPEEGEDIVFDSFTINADDMLAGKVTLSYALAPGSTPIVWVVGGIIQQFDEDYTVVGAELSWSDMGLEDLLAVGDVLQIHYQRVL